MSEQQILYSMAEGQHECMILLEGPTPAGGSRANFKTGFLRVMDLSETAPQQGVTISVPSGAGPLVAAITDPEGNAPEGVAFTVMTPSNKILDEPTPIADTELFVSVEEGSLRGLVVAEPEPGDWTIKVAASEAAGEFYVIFYTTPTVDAYNTLLETAATMVDDEVYSAIAARVGSREMGCKRCKASMWALAIVVAAAYVASAAMLVFPTGPVLKAVALLGGMTMAETATWMVKEGKKYGGSTSKWAEGLCRKMGNC